MIRFSDYENKIIMREKKDKINAFRLKAISALLLFSLCVSLYSCFGSENSTVNTSSTASSSAIISSSVSDEPLLTQNGAATTDGAVTSDGTTADETSTTTEEETTVSEEESTTEAETTAATATEWDTATAASQVSDTKRNHYSDLPIYSPAVTDVLTSSENNTKYYNTNFRISSSLQSEFQKLVNNYDLSFTFSLRDIDTEMMYSYRDDVSYRSASSIKGPFGLYAAKAIDAGKASLSDKVTYTENFYMENGSGKIQDYPFGTVFDVKKLEYLMIHESDNIAYFMLSYATGGKDPFNKMVKDLGCDNLIVSGPYWGRLTSNEMGLVWREIYYYGQSGTPGGTRVYGLFEKAKYNDLQTYMGYKVVHKSGWGHTSFNDAGIVYYKDRHFVAVVFVDRVDAYDEDHAKAQFKKVCKYLVKVMKEYTEYCKNHKDTDTSLILTTATAEQTTAATTAAAITTTELPTTTAATPTATEAPATTTEAPTTTTEAPATTTEAPVTATESPETTTEAQPTERPSETEKEDNGIEDGGEETSEG